MLWSFDSFVFSSHISPPPLLLPPPPAHVYESATALLLLLLSRQWRRKRSIRPVHGATSSEQHSRRLGLQRKHRTHTRTHWSNGNSHSTTCRGRSSCFMFTSSISGDCGVPSFKCWPPQVDRWIAVPRSETICCRCYCCGGVGAVLFSYRHQTHRIIKRGNSFLPSPLCFSPHLPPSFFFCFQQLGTARSMIPSKLTTIAIIIFQFFFFLSFFIPPPPLSLSL